MIDRIILGIDPGPTTSGMVVYTMAGAGPGRVARAYKEATLEQVRMELGALAVAKSTHKTDVEVVVECTQAGPPSTHVVKTTEVVGRIMEACDGRLLPWHGYYRREVLQALGCARKGNKDSLVRLACIELHGGDKPIACGTKKSPGPLYGVTSHAWQALGVVCAHVLPFNTQTP
jgi:hypothetical protein